MRANRSLFLDLLCALATAFLVHGQSQSGSLFSSISRNLNENVVQCLVLQVIMQSFLLSVSLFRRLSDVLEDICLKFVIYISRNERFSTILLVLEVIFLSSPLIQVTSASIVAYLLVVSRKTELLVSLTPPMMIS